MLRVLLLGGFQISLNGIPVKDINTARLQSLLAYLTLHKWIPKSKAQLVNSLKYAVKPLQLFLLHNYGLKYSQFKL